MSHKGVIDFREALQISDEMGELVRIKKPVDPYLEVPTVTKALGRLPQVPAVLFENIKGFPGFSVCSTIFAGANRMSRFLGLGPGEVTNKFSYLDALYHPIPPITVQGGPCKENIVLDKIDIGKLIPPTKGTKQVEHLYYQPLVITKNANTGGVNVGIYRSAIQGPDELTTNIRWDQHAGLQFSVTKELRRPFPVALCIGVHPAVYVAGMTKMSYGQNELGFAGALMGCPVEMVPCETIDLSVPASSEIVIEGEIDWPPKLGSEGPWPEYLGYLGMNIHPPVMKVKAITYRNDPINNMFITGAAPHFLGMGTQTQFFRHLRDFAGEFVVDTFLTRASVNHHAIVKVRKTEPHHEGLQVSVGLAAFGLAATIVDNVTLVDEDINIFDYANVDWAVATRCNPARQVHILPESRCHQNNPIAGVHEIEKEPIVRAKMIIDATIPWKYRQAEKSPGLTYFTLSSWDPLDLKAYLSESDRIKWLDKQM